MRTLEEKEWERKDFDTKNQNGTMNKNIKTMYTKKIIEVTKKSNGELSFKIVGEKPISKKFIEKELARMEKEQEILKRATRVNLYKLNEKFFV